MQASADSAQDLKKQEALSASGTAKLTDMLKRHTKQCTIQKVRCITMTQEKLTQTSYPISTLYAEASLAKAFQSLEKGADLTTQEELCSLKLPESLPLKNLNICCLRTYPDCYRITVLASHDGQDVCDHPWFAGRIGVRCRMAGA